MQIEHNTSLQTFAIYLAKQYMAKKGFTYGTVPEARALAEACDIVLTGMDGMDFRIICIIDRESNPGKQFGLSPRAVQEIGKKCLKYAGKINGTQMPLTIQIMEVGNAPTDASSRLKNFKRTSIFSKCVLSAWSVDTSSASVWTNAAFNGRFVGRTFIERLLRGPRAADADLQPVEAAIPDGAGFPFVTFGLLALLAAAFACEFFYAVKPATGLLNPDVLTLAALGGLNYNFVFQSGEWYRIFTAPFLHGGILHLLFNGVALYMAGMVLEKLVGKAWFLALFVIGAVGGSLMSLLLNPATVISIGASGAIVGLLTAAFISSFRLPAARGRTQIQINLMQMLIPSLIPLAMGPAGQHVDYAAHLGGTLSGGLAGWLMYQTWPLANPLPRFRQFAAGLAFAGSAALAFALFPITETYGTYALDQLLITNDRLPKSTAEGKLHAAQLVADFPHDPRGHYLRALAALDSKDMAGVERALRAGLNETEILRTKFPPALESAMRGLLALVLLDKGEDAEAKTIGASSCSLLTAEAIRKQLVKRGICGS